MAIIHAARDVLLEHGYTDTRVEDIIVRAGISRPTFYRHFKDKFDVARAYHGMSGDETMEPWTALGSVDFRNREAIRAWLAALFEGFEEMRAELALWAEMSKVEPDYLRRVPRRMPRLIEHLGRTIPAFARAHEEAASGNGEPGPVWIEAYFLLDQISAHGSGAVLRSQYISHEGGLDYFTSRVLRFVERYDC